MKESEIIMERRKGSRITTAAVIVSLVCLLSSQIAPTNSVILKSHTNQRDKLEMVLDAAETIESEADAE